MAGQRRRASSKASSRRPDGRPLRVLLVDGEPEVYRTLSECADTQPMTLVQVSNLAQARRHLAQSGVDLALIDSNLSDGSATKLADELTRDHGRTQAIILSDSPTYERAVEAIRAGATDLLAKPIDRSELAQRLDQASHRHRLDLERRRRIGKLKRVCRKLNDARRDVRQQVDILCQDLVAAYQELAVQMNQVVQASEFAGLIRQELDLEQLLRKTLEFLLEKAGPTNAAVFLPASADEFTLGGYVNYDCTSDSAEMLMQHLADIVAPEVAEQLQPVHATDNASLADWVGQGVPFLRDNHMIGFTCWHDDEAMAVVLLFRPQSEPFDPTMLEVCDSIAPMLGEYLAKLIRIHHRHLDGTIDEDDSDLPWGSTV